MNQKKKDEKINRLIALFTSGEIEECKREARKAVEIYPKEPFLFNLLGVIYAETALFEEAISYYKKATKCKPTRFSNLGF